MSEPDGPRGLPAAPAAARPGGSALEDRVIAEYGWVRRLAGSLLHSGADADDVAQEVVAAALLRRPRIEPAGGIRRWLHCVTRRQASLWRARGRRRREVEARGADAPACAPDPSAVVARLELHRALTDAVLDLPEPYRSVVVARFLDGRSIGEIAQEHGTAQATVRQQLARAVARLRQRLARERGKDWRMGLAALVLGRDLAPPPMTVPTSISMTAAATAAAILTMKPILAVLSAAVAIVLALWMWPRVPDHAHDPRTAAPPGHVRADATASRAAPTAADDTGQRTAVAPPSSPAPDSFALRVVDFAGVPLADVTVVLVPQRPHLVPSDLDWQTTNREGRVAFAIPAPEVVKAGSHRLLLAAEGRIFEWVPLQPPGAGAERTHSYGGPSTIRGVVTPVGDVAALGAEVHARPRCLESVRDRYRMNNELPRPVVGAFERRGCLHLLRGTAPVDPTSGAFAFHGLADGEATFGVGLVHGSQFVVHPEHTRAESVQRDSAVLRVGRTDHVVAVVPIPSIRLRAVFEDGTPAAHAHADIRAWLVDDDGPASLAFADSNGVFAIGLALESIPLHRFLDPADQPRVMRLDVHSVRHPLAESLPKFTFEMPPGVRWADAGDVVLRRLEELHVLALDPRSAPVRGAVLEGARRSAPTGDDGRTTVRTKGAEQRAFKIGAPGMLVDDYAAVGGSGTMADPLRFQLAPENRVELRLLADELVADDVVLELDGPEDLFHAADAHWKVLPSHLHRAAGVGRFDSGSKRLRRAEFEEDLTVTLVSIVPGAELTATVLDQGGAVIAQRAFVAPPFGVAQVVRLESQVAMCRIDGRVFTADGQPAKARLVVGQDTKRGNAIYRARPACGEDGRFRLRLVASGAQVPVRVECAGHALLRESLTLVDGTLAPVFTLAPGHSVVACLVDHEGAILDTEVHVVDAELGASSERLLDRSTQLARLPASDVTLGATYAGRWFEQRIDPARVRGRAELRVPEPERVPIRVAPHVAQDTVLTLGVFRNEDDRGRIQLQLHCVDGTWQPSELAIYPGQYSVRCGAYAGNKGHEATWTITEGDTAPRWLMR